jgi:Icc protein
MKTLAQISDCHLGILPNSKAVKNLQIVLDDLKKQKFENLVISGDLSHNGTLKSYEILKKMLNGFYQKIQIIAGNHDNKQNIHCIFQSKLLKTTTIGSWRIIAIDSVKTNKTSGFLRQKSLKELTKTLKNTQQKHVLIVLHHPIVPMQSDWDDTLSLENPQDLLDILKKYSSVKAVVFGHAHQAGDFSKNDLRIIACPSSAYQFNHETRIGYNLYRLFNNGTLEVQTQWL